MRFYRHFSSVDRIIFNDWLGLLMTGVSLIICALLIIFFPVILVLLIAGTILFVGVACVFLALRMKRLERDDHDFYID